MDKLKSLLKNINKYYYVLVVLGFILALNISFTKFMLLLTTILFLPYIIDEINQKIIIYIGSSLATGGLIGFILYYIIFGEKTYLIKEV